MLGLAGSIREGSDVGGSAVIVASRSPLPASQPVIMVAVVLVVVERVVHRGLRRDVPEVSVRRRHVELLATRRSLNGRSEDAAVLGVRIAAPVLMAPSPRFVSRQGANQAARGSSRAVSWHRMWQKCGIGP